MNSVFIVCILLFFISSHSIFAASLSFSDVSPSTITDPQTEYTLSVRVSIDQPDGTVYYLRGVFFKPGSKNYCGYTWNGSEWYGGPFSSDGHKKLPRITISSGSGELVMKTKIDPDDSGCQANGEYHFRVQRYTEKGSGSFDTQDIQIVRLDVTPPDPTETKTPPTPTPTIIPSDTPSPKDSEDEGPPLALEEEQDQEREDSVSSVVSMVISPTGYASLSAQVKGERTQRSHGMIWSMFVAGAMSVCAAIIYAFRLRMRHTSL